MEIIDAVWEKRNLGCETVEIRCSYEDETLDVEAINSLKQPYQVMKIPAGKADLLLQAQGLGFQVMECQIGFKRTVKDFEMPKKYQRFVKDTSYHEASQEEIEDTLRRIEAGNMFTTDRIALDSHFSKEIAGKRYANWIRDLLKNGYVLYMKTYKCEVFGWSINNSSTSKKANAILGGNFQEKVWSGAGIAGLYIVIQIAKDHGSDIICGAASINNLRNVKLLLEFSYAIDYVEYVLIKHLEDKKGI